jgi:N utilization substance protein B
MSRRKSREMALQTLFQMDHNENIAVEPALQMVLSEYEIVADKDKDYAKQLVEGATNSRSEIDGMITKAAYDWKIERMPGVDRNIVRLAIYEMKFGTEPITPGVVINEAVELAKQYGTEDSPRFVNGILGSLVKDKDAK